MIISFVKNKKYNDLAIKYQKKGKVLSKRYKYCREETIYFLIPEEK